MKKKNPLIGISLSSLKGLKIAAAWPEVHSLGQDSARKIYGLLTGLIAQYSVLNQKTEKVKRFPRTSAACETLPVRTRQSPLARASSIHVQ